MTSKWPSTILTDLKSLQYFTFDEAKTLEVITPANNEFGIRFSMGIISWPQIDLKWLKHDLENSKLVDMHG